MEDADLTLELREEAIQKVREWLADGHSWVGGFENADLSHPDIGHRILVPYDDANWEYGVVGKTTAPDNKHIGLGWRYLLDLKTRDAAEAIGWVLRG
jgi:hypothetical protein